MQVCGGCEQGYLIYLLVLCAALVDFGHGVVGELYLGRWLKVAIVGHATGTPALLEVLPLDNRFSD